MNNLLYERAFEILLEDYRTLSEYVGFSDPNEQIYSHRIYELLLRSCTEFESACKEITPQATNGNLNIVDYRNAVQTSYQVEALEVGVMIWTPMQKYITPFHGWTTNTPILNWYSDYNTVKHNRTAEFHRANLKNLTMSLGGLFVVLERMGVFGAERINRMSGATKREKIYDVIGRTFTLRYTGTS